MQFNPKALLVLVGFAVLLAIASSADSGGWSLFAEAVATALILLGVAGFLHSSRTRKRRQ